jgi:hypothetical protein
LIVDSFQALTTKKARGFRAVEKHAVQTLVKAAKDNECVLGMIMHLTKSGELKGSTIVPHTVDMNIKVGPMPDTDDEMARIVYIDGKNRFGPLGDFEATLGYSGYDFNSTVKKTEKEDKAVVPKVNRKQQELSELVRHDELSIRKACELLSVAPLRAQHLLRELTMSELYTKTGRGPDSRWNKVTEKVVQFAS